MKVKWGVLGCGGIADRRTIPGMMLADNAELVAVMDINKAAAEKVRSKYNAKYSFDNAGDLLKVKEIDAVYIATPVINHKEQAMMCAGAGKHILLEKPLALTSGEAQQIIEYCKSRNVKIGSGFMMRFSSYHREMKRIIASGGIGEIVSMRAQFTCWYPEMANAWRQTFASSGGGALMDMGVHCIDILQYITGLKAEEVAAFCGNQIFRYEVEDAASLIMRMNNGCLAYVDANFNIPDDASVSKLEIYGTGGSIVAEGTIAQDDTGKVKLVKTAQDKGYDAQQARREKTNTEFVVETGNMYEREISEFGESILKDAAVPVSAEDAVFVQKIVESAYLSNRTKTFISLNNKSLDYGMMI